MRFLHITDIHQGTSWEKRVKHIKYYDKVIFHGDYFDNRQPKEHEDEKLQISNFKKIIKLKKKYPDKVELLVGNHDQQYISAVSASGNRRGVSSSYNVIFCKKFRELLLENKEYLDYGFEYNGTVSSHAGFSKVWVALFMKIFKEEFPEDKREFSIELLNEVMRELSHEPTDKRSLRFDAIFDFSAMGTDPCGDDNIQGPCWIRPFALLCDAYYNSQIVGHTPECFDKPLAVDYLGNKVVLIDSELHDLIFETTDEVIEKTMPYKDLFDYQERVRVQLSKICESVTDLAKDINPYFAVEFIYKKM